MSSPRISADEIKAIVDAMPGTGWAAWPDGDFICFSSSLEEEIGLSSEFLSSRDANGEFSWKATLHPDDYQRLAKDWIDAMQRKTPYQVTHRRRDAKGEYRWIRSVARAQVDELGNVLYWLGTTIDIHDTISAMEASEERERDMRALIDTVPAPIWSANEKGEPTAINRALARLTGIRIEDIDKDGTSLLTQVIAVAVHPDDRQAVSEELRRSFDTGTGFKLKYRQKRSNGDFGWTSGEAQPLRDRHGNITRWFGVCHDIDDEMRSQVALAEREARLAMLINAIPGLVWASTPEGTPTYFSRRLEEWAGFKIEDLVAEGPDMLGSAIRRTVYPEDQASVAASMQYCYDNGTPWNHRFRQRHRDGSWRWMDARMEPLRDSAGTITQWIGLQVDIEDEVRTHESLRTAQDNLARAAQYAGMAELSASIAHEVSQPLASVIMNADAGRRWLEMSPPNIERAKFSVDCVVRDANISSEVIKRIRALFQHRVKNREPEDINGLVREVHELMSEELVAAGISLEYRLQEGLPNVPVDRVQIQQVLVNLIQNSIEALATKTVSERHVEITTRKERGAIVVEVSDTGDGLRDVDRVFLPFFTTKESGMGMGLAICQSIVISHGGRITAENSVNGPCLTFSLPTLR